MKQWREQRVDVQKCGQAIAKANREGKLIPDSVYDAMGKRFSADEIEAIESYIYYVSEGLTGADYLTPQEMEARENDNKENHRARGVDT